VSNSRIGKKLDSLERSRRVKQALYIVLIGTIVGLTYLGLGYIQFRTFEIINDFPNFFDFLGGFLPPDFTQFTNYTKRVNQDVHGLRALEVSFHDGGRHIIDALTSQGLQTNLLKASVVTVTIGFVGTVLGFPLALFFGVLGSERVIPFPFNFIFRGTMSAIRAIPAIVWLILYIPVLPPSPAAAVLAITTDTIGNLGRLFTDELEEIDEGPIEAIQSTGASRIQTVGFGMLSQVSSSYVAWTLYILEINTRIAISLGVVGAGGLGFIIDSSMRSALYSQTAAGIVMVFVIVLSIELISSRIRARLRPGEHQSRGFFEQLRSMLDANKWLGSGTGPERN
jgi:phosphonate transport system permease protein